MLNKGKTNKFTNIPNKLILLNTLAQIGNNTKFVETEKAKALLTGAGILILVNNLSIKGANATIAKTHKNDN